MSTSETPPPSLAEPPPPPPVGRSGCLTAVMVIFGVIMLLPGLCALLLGGISIVSDGRIEQGMAPFVVLGLLVGAFGIVLIAAAIRGRKG